MVWSCYFGMQDIECTGYCTHTHKKQILYMQSGSITITHWFQMGVGCSHFWIKAYYPINWQLFSKCTARIYSLDSQTQCNHPDISGILTLKRSKVWDINSQLMGIAARCLECGALYLLNCCTDFVTLYLIFLEPFLFPLPPLIFFLHFSSYYRYQHFMY